MSKGKQTAKNERATSMKKRATKRWIVHIDMDSFFVSVERLKDPSLRGKPVAVGGNPEGRSVISSASYEARRYGVRSAMPVTMALKLCPELILIRGSFQDYDFYYRKIKSILESFSPAVEMTSIDEGYLDLTGTEYIWGNPRETIHWIRWQIYEETGLPSSLGLASNRLVAKIASDYCKPAGALYIPHGKERDFLAPLPVEALPGVGDSTRKKLEQYNILTIGQLATLPGEQVQRIFGLNGYRLWQAANGRCNPINRTSWEQKSFSREITLPNDTSDQDYLLAVLQYLCEFISLKARCEGLMGRRITVKLRYEDFRTITRSYRLKYHTADPETIYLYAKQMFLSCYQRRIAIRLLGISISQLFRNGQQLSLFHYHEEKRRMARIKAMDKIRKRFGFNAILSGKGIELLSYQKHSLSGTIQNNFH